MKVPRDRFLLSGLTRASLNLGRGAALACRTSRNMSRLCSVVVPVRPGPAPPPIAHDTLLRTVRAAARHASFRRR